MGYVNTLLTEYDGSTITYDQIGNPLSYRGYTMTWQRGRQLATLNGNGVSATYQYDSDGLRNTKTVNGVTHEYYYDGTSLIAEKRGSDMLVWNGSGFILNGTYYYYKTNTRGDVIGLYDANGTQICEYEYDAWGKLLSVTDMEGNAITSATHPASINPIRYRSYYYDVETGLYYLQSRYYDPETGRFINADGYITTGQGLLGTNMFAYCENNPVNREDISGMFWKEIGNWIKNAWNSVKTWVSKTFGAGHTKTVTISSIYDQPVPDPLPIVIEYGVKKTKKIEHGNSSKPISVYSNLDVKHPIKSSSVGSKVNFKNATFSSSFALDDVGICADFIDGDTTTSYAIKLNPSELKLEFEGATSIPWDDGTIKTTYTNVSISGWFIVFVYAYATSGQSIPSPEYSYQYN